MPRCGDDGVARNSSPTCWTRKWPSRATLPREIARQKAAIDLWLKELAPSTELRKWFGHDPERWDEFRKRYWSELSEKGDLLTLLKHRTREGNVTFVFAAGDMERNSAVALKEYLEERL